MAVDPDRVILDTDRLLYPSTRQLERIVVSAPAVPLRTGAPVSEDRRTFIGMVIRCAAC